MQTRPPDADVVVVGAGILGLSTAIHLLTEGVGRVVVVERDAAGQGTSAAGGGFIGASYAAGYSGLLGDEELAAEAYGVEFYRDLAERHEFGFRADGTLFLARDEAAWAQLEPLRLHPDATHREVLEPADVAGLTGGLVRPAGLVRGLFDPTWAQLSAERATRALAAEFVALGGELRERTPVLRLLGTDGSVTGVETLHGPVAADRVVLACGSWTNALLRAHDRFLPMVTLLVSRIVTAPQGIPGTLPAMFIAGFSEDGNQFIWAREEQGGLLWGIKYNGGPRESLIDRDPPERYDQISLAGVAEQRGAGTRAAVLLPELMHPSYTVGHGAPCHTIDGRAIIGPLAGLDGAFVIAGCNESGVMHGPGWGRALAELVVRGAAGLADVGAWSPERFDGRLRSERDVFDSMEHQRRE